MKFVHRESEFCYLSDKYELKHVDGLERMHSSSLMKRRKVPPTSQAQPNSGVSHDQSQVFGCIYMAQRYLKSLQGIAKRPRRKINLSRFFSSWTLEFECKQVKTHIEDSFHLPH